MNRRTFAKTGAAALSPLARRKSWGDDGPVPMVYFVDGYHDGVRPRVSVETNVNRKCSISKRRAAQALSVNGELGEGVPRSPREVSCAYTP
jgi:hypothetical protein